MSTVAPEPQQSAPAKKPRFTKGFKRILCVLLAFIAVAAIFAGWRYQRFQMLFLVSAADVEKHARIGECNFALDFDWSDSSLPETRYTRKNMYVRRAVARIELYDLEGAERDIAKARELDGALAPTDYRQLAEAVALVAPAKSEQYYRQAIQDMPDNDPAYTNLAAYLLRKSASEKAPKPEFAAEAKVLYEQALVVYLRTTAKREKGKKPALEWSYRRHIAIAAAYAGQWEAAQDEASQALALARETLPAEKSYEKRFKTKTTRDLEFLLLDCMNKDRPDLNTR